MIYVQSEIDGKQALYGEIKGSFENEGFILGGNWDYKQGYFDTILSQETQEGETIYLRVPASVIDGALDDHDALLEFGTPFVIKHVVHTGIENDQYQDPMIDQAGISSFWNQFQKPLDSDGNLENLDRWIEEGTRRLERIIKYLQ